MALNMESAGLWTTFEDLLTSKFDLRVNYTLPAHSRVVWLLVGTWYQDQYETIPLSPPMCWLFKINLSGLIHVPMKWCHLAHSGDSERQGRSIHFGLFPKPISWHAAHAHSSPHHTHDQVKCLVICIPVTPENTINPCVVSDRNQW